MLNQADVLDQDFDRKPGASHAFDKFDPPNIDVAVIPDTTFQPIYWLDESNTLIITQRIRRNIVLFTDFRNLHRFTSDIVYHLESTPSQEVNQGIFSLILFKTLSGWRSPSAIIQMVSSDPSFLIMQMR